MSDSRPTLTTCQVCEIHAESVFRIDGMDCREEVVILERHLNALQGVESIAADLMGQRLRVTHDAARLSTSAIVEEVARTGMRAWLEHEEPVDRRASIPLRQTLLVVSGCSLAAGIIIQLAGGPWLAATLAFAVAIGTGGTFSVRRAWSAARTLSLDINVLMTLAVVGAIAIGEWSEAATVVFLFAVAQMLETRSLDRARRAIRGLMDLAPAMARVRRQDGEALVPLGEVCVGETILVGPGDKIPLDGVVLAGRSPVNQAPITGESLPVDKEPGDGVFGGTINGRGALDVRVTRLQGDSTLARIIHLVETAQAQRAPAQAFVERFARYYTPVVIAGAMLVAIVPPALFGQPFHQWFYRALVLLVISCPCALVISTPVSIVSALAAAARQGVLIKGGIHLENAGRVRCVAFDKTGTLTAGAPHVVNVVPLGEASSRDVLRAAASVESRSEHPIGRAILRHAVEQGLPPDAAESFTALEGRGAEARIGPQSVLVGNHRLFEERGLCTPEIHERLDSLAEAGLTSVLVARSGRAIGILSVADRVRDAGRDAMDLLRQHGVRRIVLLTGDNHATACATAHQLGIDDVRAELLPEDKVNAVRELQRAYGIVAMVGDGINDAPALAAADVGIAMAVAGSDVALETADVALMADELLKIPFTVRLSRATLRNIKANIGVSLGLKAACLVLAVAGIATLWMAILADTGASLIVIANGLRLLRST